MKITWYEAPTGATLQGPCTAHIGPLYTVIQCDITNKYVTTPVHGWNVVRLEQFEEGADIETLAANMVLLVEQRIADGNA
jgi:hypothetical protein